MEQIARALLQTGSILVNLSHPFRLVSGTESPVYVDCRRLISFPEAREAITEGFSTLVDREIGAGRVDVIAGGETAGIPYAALLAQQLRKPLIYVRKEPKGYGLDAQIEGVLNSGQRTLLVEDLVTDGGSKLRFKEGIERAGGVVKDCLTIFEYYSERVRLRRARETLGEHGIQLHSLTNWDEALQIAAAEGRFTGWELAQVWEFLKEL